MRLSNTKDNLALAAHLFLRSIKAKITLPTLVDRLQNHPDYPSLLALSDVLNEWKIENMAMHLSTTELLEVPTPFLAQLRVENGIFAFVEAVSSQSVRWWHSEKGWQKENMESFTEKYQGIVLLAENNEQAEEKNYAENRKQEIMASLRLPLVLMSTLLIFVLGAYLAFDVNTTWNTYALASVKLIGVIVSSLLLWYQIDKNNTFVKNLCQVNKKTNCDSILNSEAANLFSWLSWSEIGFFYFVGTLILTLTKFETLLTVFTLLALPYTFYSIYYQAFKAKQYCTLCLSVVVLLWLEVAFAPIPLPLSPTEKGEWMQLINSLSFGGAVHTEGWGGAVSVTVFLSFLLPITLWTFFKPFLKEAMKASNLEGELRRFKNNPNVFWNLLRQGKSMPAPFSDMDMVLLGKAEAAHTLIVVTNPYCAPCTRTHREVEELISANENINCFIVFLATNEENDKRGDVARHILSLPAQQRAEALNAWYEHKELSTLTVSESAKAQIEKHQTWCNLAQITATPTLFYDGHELPNAYKVRDLQYLSYQHSDFAKSTII
jgi:uncharacterized membrane protein